MSKEGARKGDMGYFKGNVCFFQPILPLPSCLSLHLRIWQLEHSHSLPYSIAFAIFAVNIALHRWSVNSEPVATHTNEAENMLVFLWDNMFQALLYTL